MTGAGVLSFRPLCADDAPRLHEIMSDWAVVRQLGGWPWPADSAFTLGRCQPFEGEGFVWAVLEEGRLVGSMGVTRGPDGPGLGYAFDLATAGRGIATRAATRALDTAFAEFDWPVVRATAWHDNPGSQRVLRKLGFAHWATRFEHAKARRLPTLTYEYRLPKADWRIARARTPVLKTQRLRLRPLTRQDIGWLSDTVNDFEISKWLVPVRHPYSHTDGEDFWAQVNAGEVGKVWVIEEGKHRVGLISHGRELGYWLAPEAWGRGLMTEAARAVVTDAFADGSRDELHSSHFTENDASRRVLEKLGFKDVGTHVHHSLARGEDVPGRSMRLTRDRWQRLSAPAQ